MRGAGPTTTSIASSTRAAPTGRRIRRTGVEVRSAGITRCDPRRRDAASAIRATRTRTARATARSGRVTGRTPTIGPEPTTRRIPTIGLGTTSRSPISPESEDVAEVLAGLEADRLAWRDADLVTRAR